MKNNEWNVPSDYFEKNKKALLPIRKFPSAKWIFALAAACAVGVGVFMLKREDIGSKHLSTKEDIGSKHLSTKEDIGSKNLSTLEDIGSDHLSTKEDIGSKHLSTKEDVGSEHLSTTEDIGAKNLSTKAKISEELNDIPREELVEYLLEEDSDFIENFN